MISLTTITRIAPRTDAGIAADIAARLTAQARPGEVLTSRTVKDLAAGSGISFTHRGAHHLPDILAGGRSSPSSRAHSLIHHHRPHPDRDTHRTG